VYSTSAWPLRLKTSRFVVRQMLFMGRSPSCTIAIEQHPGLSDRLLSAVENTLDIKDDSRGVGIKARLKRLRAVVP